MAPALVLALLLVASLGAASGDDPYRPQQWYLERIGAPSVWERTAGAGEVIAIVDSGVDLAHPDLVDRLHRDDRGRVVGWDFVDDDDRPQDEHEDGHGTMVAGIAGAAADNGLGVAGVAPTATLMPIRVLDEDGAGSARHVDAGIRWAVDHGADVINLSLESVVPLPGEVVSRAPVEAVRYAWDRGVVVVAAAGNSSNPFNDYPESAPVVLVGATDRDDAKADFSDSGRRDAVLAPGVDIVSTWCQPTDSGPCSREPRFMYGKGSGTSFSAPQVAGAVALLLATGLDHTETVERIRATAVDLGPEGPDPQTGVGRLDVSAAVGPPSEPAGDGSSPDTGPADDGDAPDPATPPASEPPPSPPGPDPTPDRATGSPAPAEDPSAQVTTVPAPGTEIEGIEPVDPVAGVILRGLATVLVLSTGGLVLAVRRVFP